jgi:hypothetical protein
MIRNLRISLLRQLFFALLTLTIILFCLLFTT